jgi:hypothetical protein
MKLSAIALTTTLFLSLPASVALAQAPATGNDIPAPPASPSPAAPAPEATPAPSASPSASTPPSSEKKTASTKKKKSVGPGVMTRQEIDHSVESGTVPSRYRRQVPKEYQQYVPFDKQ